LGCWRCTFCHTLIGIIVGSTFTGVIRTTFACAIGTSLAGIVGITFTGVVIGITFSCFTCVRHFCYSPFVSGLYRIGMLLQFDYNFSMVRGYKNYTS